MSLDEYPEFLMNDVVLIGRVGRDPEPKYFESGNTLATFSLAVDRPRDKDNPDWFELEIWGKTAEVAINYVKRGREVAVTGRLKFDSWLDKTTGKPRSGVKVVVRDLDLLGKAQAQSPPATRDVDYDENYF